MNGPVKYRLRDGGERIANWMKAVRQGAEDAGGHLRMNLFSSGFPPELRASLRAKLDGGLFISGTNSANERLWAGSAGLGGTLWAPHYPVRGIGNPDAFLAGLRTVYHNPDGDGLFTRITVDDSLLDDARQLIDIHLAHPQGGRVQRTSNLLAYAVDRTPDEASAEALVDSWEQVQHAIHAILQVRQKGFVLVLNFCTVSMRWLVRPLVPEPELLTPAETAHYRDFVFAAGDAKNDPHFGMVLGKAVFNGESVMWMSRWCLQEAIGTLQGVRDRLRKIAAAADGAQAEWLNLQADRVAALACLAVNARNCIMYQYTLDIADQPQYGPNQTDYDDNILYDQRALTLRKIAREEIDNIAELIPLARPEVIHFAATGDDESVFMLGPDLPAALRRKLDIMLDHWQDYERLYPATKLHDLEPVPKGNLPPLA